MNISAARRRTALYVSGILLLQIVVSLPRLNRYFLEGRAHWTSDSAYETLRAIHSLDRTIESPWKIFGLAEYVYDDTGREKGLSHYAHHPALAATLFRAYAAVAGFSHWVPRTFSLIFSLGITVLLFLLLNRELDNPELAAVLTLLYALLPLNYNYQDAWKHETVATFVVLLNYWLARRLDEGRGVRRTFTAAFFLLFQAEWAVYAIGAGLWIYLFFTRPKKDRRFLGGVLAAGAASVLLNVWILYHLGFDWHAMHSQALYRMSAGMAAVAPIGWFRRQLGFAGMNFSPVNMVLLAALVLWQAAHLRRAARVPLLVFGGISMLAALAWITVFRNLSYVHHYHQWYLGLAFVLILAGSLEEFQHRWKWSGVKPQWAALALLVPLLGASAFGSLRLESDIQEGDFAAPEDIVAIRDQTKRLVVASDGSGGPKDWWISPHIKLYSDPHYKSWVSGIPRAGIRGGIVLIEDLKKIDPASDMVVTLKSRQAAAQARDQLKPFGVRRLIFQFESPAFAFWTPEMD
jgi:hypothetical protein